MNVNATNVVVNGQILSQTTIDQIRTTYNVSFSTGNYWYDRISGAWGYTNGPAVALTRHGMNIGGPLTRNASGGRTNVFFNGRELHNQDIMILYALLGMVIPGRYWIDHYGNFGPEGGMMIGNIWVIASTRNLPPEQKRTFTTYDLVGVKVI